MSSVDSKKTEKKVNTVSYDYSGRNRVFKNGQGRTAHRTVIRLVKLLDVLLVTIPFGAAWYLYYSHQVYLMNFYRKGNWVVVGLYLILYYTLSHLYQGYSINISRISEIVYAQTLGALIADGIMYIVMWLLIRFMPNIPVMLTVLGVQFLIILLWATLAHKWYFKNNPPIPTAVIYDELQGIEKLVTHYGLEKRFKIVKKVSIHELH